MKLRIKKGDTVKVITGNDRGQIGRVLVVYPKKQTILVESINIRTRHGKPSQQNPKGGKTEKEMPVHYSNVQLLDSNKQPTRIGIRFEDKDGKLAAVRYAKTNNKNI